MLGLALALEKMGIRVARLCVDPAPAAYSFLPGAEEIGGEPPPWSAQLGMVVDCDGLSRVGALEPVFASLPRLIDIDHHATDRVFGEVQITDVTAGACAELVFDLLHVLHVPLDEEIATCLYTGVLTDTGRFTYGNTTPTSLSIAAELVRAGAKPNFIARKVYAERSIAATHLLGIALSRLLAHFGGQVVSATLTRADFTSTGAASTDTEGIIDHLRAIGGPRVAVLFVQAENGEVRVSLRSDGTIDASSVALALGGGGHAMAAGCTCQGSLDGVRDRVFAELEKWLVTAGSPDAS
jgi:phosphoesterase RecJ-like protein